MSARQQALGLVAPEARKEARRLGRKVYFVPVPCPRGHLTDRRVSDRRCVECCRLDGLKKAADRAALTARIREQCQSSALRAALRHLAAEARRKAQEAERAAAKRAREEVAAARAREKRSAARKAAAEARRAQAVVAPVVAPGVDQEMPQAVPTGSAAPWD